MSLVFQPSSDRSETLSSTDAIPVDAMNTVSHSDDMVCSADKTQQKDRPVSVFVFTLTSKNIAKIRL